MLLRAAEEKVSEVPGATVPVLVMLKVGFAVKWSEMHANGSKHLLRVPGTGIVQPEMKGVATARTSDGEKAMSNA